MHPLLRAKLRSNRGASITFALLLFLVCTVIGVIVLVAGTAASGRLSQLADSDARYYAVTSAAELLKNEIDGKQVTVTRSVSKTVTVTRGTYSDPEDPSTSVDEVKVDNPDYNYGTTDTPPVNFFVPKQALVFLQQATNYLLYGATVAPSNGEEIWSANARKDWGDEKPPLTGGKLTVNVDNAMVVEVAASISAGGDLILTLTCPAGAAENDPKYQVTMTFTADLQSEELDEAAGNIPPEVRPDTTGLDTYVEIESVETEYTYTKTDTVTWYFRDMR